MLDLLGEFVVDLVEVFVGAWVFDDFVEVEQGAFVADKLKDIIFKRPLNNLVVLVMQDQQRLKNELEHVPLRHVDTRKRLHFLQGEPRVGE